MSNRFSDYFLYTPWGNTEITPPSLPCSDISLICVYETSSQLVARNFGFGANAKDEYSKVVHVNFCRTWKLIQKLNNKPS